MVNGGVVALNSWAGRLTTWNWSIVDGGPSTGYGSVPPGNIADHSMQRTLLKSCHKWGEGEKGKAYAHERNLCHWPGGQMISASEETTS